MKKLMIAAAAAALVGGAYAGCADIPTPTPVTVTPAAVYQWKFSGKTGLGVVIKGTADRTVPGGCADDGTIPGRAAEVIRVPGTLCINAYTYICDDECWNFGTYLVNPTAAQYQLKKPYKSVIYNNNFVEEINAAEVIGKTGSQYELEGTAVFKTIDGDVGPTYTYELTFAGFGSYAKKYGRISSVSGNFAGLQTPPRYNGTVTGLAKCPPADYWVCTAPGVIYAEDPMHASVAYGTWSIKYNSSASKKLANDVNYRVLRGSSITIAE